MLEARPRLDPEIRDALRRHRHIDRGPINEADLPRFHHTLELIGRLDPKPRRLCDLATFGAIDPAIHDLFGIESITTTGVPTTNRIPELIFVDDQDRVTLRFPHDAFDIEERFPYVDGAFDCVVFTEVLEHLSRDPMHTISEINRILETGGWLILSTPNAVSLDAVLRAFRGFHPSMWSPYSHEANRDRHNREYTPSEVQRLLQSAGFAIAELSCRHVFGTRRLNKRLAHVLLGAGRTMLAPRTTRWAGELIFAVARKMSAVQDRFPPFLYY